MNTEQLDKLEALARENLRYGAVVMVEPATILALINDNKSRRNMLDIVINSVCWALERAGVKDVDDPGEAIDVLVADKDAEIARLREALRESIVFMEKMEESHRHPIMAAINARAALNQEPK